MTVAPAQRSRTAILAGAKIVITEVGSYESNMVDIAARAQVSRATVYNHFADKEEMMFSLLESEILRLVDLAKKSPSPKDALLTLSREISGDLALRKMTETDPKDIAAFVTIGAHPIWAVVQDSLVAIFGAANSSLVLHWLLGQVASPLSAGESAQQADQIARSLS
ncbi:MAG: TetR/AcrR family transcriptional regulator [Actinomycetes bacterium]|jgi:AcrR family transcriptional regulator